MNCFDCAALDTAIPAVALCVDCGAALCTRHAHVTARRLNPHRRHQPPRAGRPARPHHPLHPLPSRKPRRCALDLMIASIAIAEGLPLCTTNPGDFVGLEQLMTVVPVRRPLIVP